MTIHILKTDRAYWLDASTGRKPFEVRRDDRDPPYESGDIVALVHSDPGPEHDFVLPFRIGYLARGGRIPEGYCVFELSHPDSNDIVRIRTARGQEGVVSR